MPNTFLFAFGIFVAQHGPNIGLKPSETRKTPPLALLNPSPPRGAQIKQQFSPSWNLKMVPLFPRRGLSKKPKKIEIHTLAPKCMPFYRAANPPDKPKKGMEIHTCAPKCIPFFHSANPPDNPKKGIETHTFIATSLQWWFFLEIKRFCHIVFSMFLFVVFFPIKTGMIFCLDAVAQRLL